MSSMLKNIGLSLSLLGVVLVNTTTMNVIAQDAAFSGVFLPEDMVEKIKDYVSEIDPLTPETKVTHQDAAKAINITWPCIRVNKNVTTIKQDIEKEINARCEIRFPATQSEKFRNLMVRRYGVYKIGDWVNVENSLTKEDFEGTLEFFNKSYVKVGGVTILREDIKDKHFLLRLDDEACKRRIQLEVQRYEGDRGTKIKQYAQKITIPVTKNMYEKAGYINTDREKFTGQWFEPINFVNSAYELMCEELIARKFKEDIKVDIGIKVAEEPKKEEKVENADVKKDNQEESSEETDDFGGGDDEGFDDEF